MESLWWVGGTADKLLRDCSYKSLFCLPWCASQPINQSLGAPLPFVFRLFSPSLRSRIWHVTHRLWKETAVIHYKTQSFPGVPSYFTYNVQLGWLDWRVEELQHLLLTFHIGYVTFVSFPFPDVYNCLLGFINQTALKTLYCTESSIWQLLGRIRGNNDLCQISRVSKRAFISLQSLWWVDFRELC